MVSPYSRHFSVVIWSDLLLDELDTLNEMAAEEWKFCAARLPADPGSSVPKSGRRTQGRSTRGWLGCADPATWSG